MLDPRKFLRVILDCHRLLLLRPTLFPREKRGYNRRGRDCHIQAVKLEPGTARQYILNGACHFRPAAISDLRTDGRGTVHDGLSQFSVFLREFDNNCGLTSEFLRKMASRDLVERIFTSKSPPVC